MVCSRLLFIYGKDLLDQIPEPLRRYQTSVDLGITSSFLGVDTQGLPHAFFEGLGDEDDNWSEEGIYPVVHRRGEKIIEVKVPLAATRSVFFREVKESASYAISTSLPDLVRLPLDGAPSIIILDDMVRFSLQGHHDKNSRCPYQNISIIEPGSIITIDIESGSCTVISNEIAPPSVVDVQDLENDIVTGLRKFVARSQSTAFALSGGVDSTLLTNLAIKHQLCDEVVCITGTTGAGLDDVFTRKAADILGIKLHSIQVPYGWEMVELHRQLTQQQGIPVPLNGNAIAFAYVARVVKELGFDQIIDGTGADQIFAGTYSSHGITWYKDRLKKGDIVRAEKLYDHCVKHKLLKEKELRGGRVGKTWNRPSFYRGANKDIIKCDEDRSFSEYLLFEFQKGNLQNWLYQNAASSELANILIGSPFVTDRMSKYIWLPPEMHFQDGVNKYLLRKLMNIDREVAWRTDNQGFRWKSSRFLEKNKHHIMKEIKESSLVRRMLSLYGRTALLAAQIKSKKSLLLPLYSLAVYDRIHSNSGKQWG